MLYFLLKIIIFISVSITLRISYLLFIKAKPNKSKNRKSPATTLICLGSGGHTKEMIAILQEFNFKNYSPRHYIIADNDITSKSKVTALESPTATDFTIQSISRSRAVKQSYFTSIFTTIISTFECIPLLLKLRPEMILCNGPGTCVPICLVSFMLKVFFVQTQCRIVFIESFCRVQSLSLSGKILLYVADLFAVHWVELKQMSNRIEYFGQIM